MIVCRVVPIGSADASALLRAYVTELVDRWHGRTMPSEVVDEVMAELGTDGLVVFLVAYRTLGPDTTAEPVGCVGLRRLGPATGEVKRMYVRPAVRRLGVGRSLLETLERHARCHGMTELRLDTRNDLVEAHALYARQGFTEIPAYNDEPFAQRWFGKVLTRTP